MAARVPGQIAAGPGAPRSSARGTSVQLIGPIASRSAVPGREVAAAGARVARRDRQPEQPVAELGGVHAQRPAGVGPGEPPSGGDQVGAVPQLPAPAAEREPPRR